MKLKVRYNEEVDILTVDTGIKAATSSSVDFGLIAGYSSEEGYDIVGIELMSAGRLIAPFCALNSTDSLGLQKVASKIKSLETNYDRESDILTINTSRDIEFSYDVGDGLIAYMGYENNAYKDAYDVVGIELRNASKLLFPWFRLNRAPLAPEGAASD